MRMQQKIGGHRCGCVWMNDCDRMIVLAFQFLDVIAATIFRKSATFPDNGSCLPHILIILQDPNRIDSTSSAQLNPRPSVQAGSGPMRSREGLFLQPLTAAGQKKILPSALDAIMSSNNMASCCRSVLLCLWNEFTSHPL